jgi:hypothetical protein
MTSALRTFTPRIAHLSGKPLLWALTRPLFRFPATCSDGKSPGSETPINAETGFDIDERH